MPAKIRGKSDKHLAAIQAVLTRYGQDHPRADIEVYRHSSVSIRIRIIDPEFKGVARADRHENLWRLLEELPESVQSQISVLLLLTPEEKKKSFASSEFDNPVPSRL